MKRQLLTLAAAAAFILTGLASASARADDLFAGLYAHAIAEAHGREDDSFDASVGYRWDTGGLLRWLGAPKIHLITAFNDKYSTDFIAAGFDWPIKLPARFYFRPGIGLAYTTGKASLPAVNAPGLTPVQIQARFNEYNERITFGDNVLFEPEFALGYALTPKLAIEASYIHLSNGQILHQGRNEGLDDAGLRLSYHFR